MKAKSIALVALLSTTTLALCVLILLAPRGMAAEKDTLNATDVKFVKHEAAAGMGTVKMAELAVKKAERADVKAFAEMIVADHTRANEELKALAAKKGVEVSGVIDPKYADTVRELEKFSGAEFDKNYLAEMVSGHKKCVDNFEEASKEAGDVDLKTWAAKMLPGLKAHLEKARDLSTKKVSSTNSSSVTGEPDNTARNARDRDARTVTPLDQGSSKSDTEITAQIRKDIIATENMSVNAQNVKIITINGKVTLRGPVNNADEKRLIAEIAARVVRADHVDCLLEVK